MFKQEWKDVPTWEEIFEVSNYGRLHNKITNNYSIGSKTKCGYYKVTLQWKNRSEQWNIHRLIIKVWNRQMLKNEEAHHKNEFKFCNCIFNLEIKNKSEHLREHKTGMRLSQQTKRKISETQKRTKNLKKV